MSQETAAVMIPVKVECECGQRYAFEVPVGSGPVSFPVICPTCGADGSAAANAIIAQGDQPSAPLVIPAAPRVRLHIPTPVAVAPTAETEAPAPAPPPPRRALLPGQLEPEQAQIQARAKIFWGDPQEEVVKYLMLQGFSVADAKAAVDVIFQERVTTLRGIGFRKLVTGSVCIAVPVISYIAFTSIGFIPVKLFAITVMIGAYGVWLAIRGTLMLVSPKSESCDVADQ